MRLGDSIVLLTWGAGLATRAQMLLQVRVTRAAHCWPGPRAGATRGITRKTRALGIRIQPGLTPTALRAPAPALAGETPVTCAVQARGRVTRTRVTAERTRPAL